MHIGVLEGVGEGPGVEVGPAVGTLVLVAVGVRLGNGEGLGEPADSVVVSDTIWLTRGKPSTPAGLRGMQTFSITLQTAEHDVHSGLTGGAARNPLAELAWPAITAGSQCVIP